MKMSSLKILCAAIAFVIATGAQAGAVPTPIAPPAAGSAAAFPAAAPNPAQFVFGSGTVASSTAVNSNFNKLYSDMAQVVTALNGCTFSTGNAIATVVATAPITANVSACVAGQGTGETLNLGLTGSIGIANGGTGTATPGLVGGPNISITNPWPNQTIGLSGIIPVTNGGTNTATPALVGGPNISISNPWPNQTVGLSGVVPIANGGTGSATPSGVVAGTNVTITGTFPNQTISAATANSGTPAYNVVGNVVTGYKVVQGTANFGASASVSISFSGSAVFTSSTSYACYADGNQTNNGFYFNQANGITTSINTIGNVALTATIGFICSGT